MHNNAIQADDGIIMPDYIDYNKKVISDMRDTIKPPTPVKMGIVIPEPEDTRIVPSKVKPLDVSPRNRKPKKVRSSINKRRIDEIPDVYHRPLVGASTYFGKFTDKGKPVISKKQRRDFDHSEDKMVGKMFENPNVNALKAFEAVTNVVETNIYLTKKLVVATNHSHRKDAYEVEYLRDQWHKSLEDCNLCWKCRKPIKVHNVGVKREKVVTKSRGGLNVGTHFKRQNAVLTQGIAGTVKSHCEIIQKENGKLMFQFVCESGSPMNRRNIEIREIIREIRVKTPRGVFPKKFKTVAYFEIDKITGEAKEVTVPSSYEVRDARCTCMSRQKAVTVTVKPSR